MRVGLIGAGAISPFHIKGWQAQSAAQLVAVCDPDAERARGRAAEFGISSVYSDVEQMFDGEQLDAVDIVAPVGVHGSLVRHAAARDAHVMCQKPLTPTVAEAQALIDDVGDRVRFMVHENYRFRPHYVQVRKWIAEGRIGEIQHARMIVRSASMVAPAGETPFLLARQPYLAGFKRLLMFEVLIHHIDTLRAILGELDVVSAITAKVNPALAGEDVAVIAFKGRDSALTAVIDGNISARGYPPLPSDRLEIVGSEDTLIFERDRLFLVSNPHEAVQHDMQQNYQTCFTDAIADFVEGVRTGRPFQTDRLDNLQTLKLMEAAYRAAGVAIV